jgi:uncharacterized delta-60 repeat protein
MRAYSWLRDRIGGGHLKNKPVPQWRPRLEDLEDRAVPAGGVLDPTFGSGGVVSSSLGSNIRAYAVATYPAEGTANDGKIVVAGAYDAPNHRLQFGVVRYNLNGSLDTSFGGGGEATYPASTLWGVLDVAVRPDGKILAAGESNSHFIVVRFNVDGSLDKSFGNRGAATTTIVSKNFERIYTLALQPDGKIVAAGTTTPPNSTSREIVLARYTATGTLDTTFGKGGLALDHIPTSPLAGGDTDRLDVAVDPGTGQIVVEAANALVQPQGDYPAMVIRYTGGGALDKSFGGTGYVSFDGKGLPVLFSMADVAIQPKDHRILLEGRAVNAGFVQGVARLNPDGTLDGNVTVTNNHEGGVIDTIKLQADGRILVGDAGIPGPVLAVSRYNPDLSPDTSFGDGGVAILSSLNGEEYAGMALEPDGRIVVVGNPDLGYWRVDVARFLATGPQIGSLVAAPTGGGVLLTASGITDGNPGSHVSQMTFFYYDGSGNKVTLGTGVPDGSGAWTIPVALPNGTTVFAQALDSLDALGEPLSINL